MFNTFRLFDSDSKRSTWMKLIETNATEEEFKGVIRKVCESENYTELDILPALHEHGFIAVEVTPENMIDVPF